MSVVPCPPNTPVTRGVVVFDSAAFKAAFTSFATVADPALQLSFQMATTLLDNSCGSRVKDATKREFLLNLLVAHVTALKDGENGQPPAGVVGRVDRAQEGSVSVSASMGTMDRGQAYYAQTQWGAMYWQATARFRTMVYVPAPPVCADFPNPGFPPPYNGDCGC